MTKITGFLLMNWNGVEVSADCFGNNVAFSCPRCGHPVLAIARKNQRGSDASHPTKCKGCGHGYFLDVREIAQKIYIHEAPGREA